MAKKGTLLFLGALAICAVLLCACSIAAGKRFKSHRFFVVTCLAATLLAGAYVLAFTLQVERGQAVLQSAASYPPAIPSCAPFHQEKNGRCVAALDTSRITHDYNTFYLTGDQTTSAPLATTGKPKVDASTCCYTKDLPYTEVNAMCPDEELLMCPQE